jgi:hypothetical protein
MLILSTIICNIRKNITKDAIEFNMPNEEFIALQKILVFFRDNGLMAALLKHLDDIHTKVGAGKKYYNYFSEANNTLFTGYPAPFGPWEYKPCYFNKNDELSDDDVITLRRVFLNIESLKNVDYNCETTGGYYQKYLKYKQKYINLKKQIGGNFYFSVYVFSKEPLDDTRKNNMIALLKGLYGGEIKVVLDPAESPYGGYLWSEAVRYINDKSFNVPYYKNLKHVTSFVIENVPRLLLSDMDDDKLSTVEHQVNNKLSSHDLNTLSMPDIRGGIETDFSRGWGFQNMNNVVITLVEKN